MSATDWYPRYVGDYTKKTSHLSLMQHGAYTRLLDWYYTNEKPLPSDLMQLHRVCMAFASEEIDAVHSVLHEFFELQEDGWHNLRADKELLKRSSISGKRKVAAEKRWSGNDASAYASACVLHSGLHAHLHKKKEREIEKEVDKSTSEKKMDFPENEPAPESKKAIVPAKAPQLILQAPFGVSEESWQEFMKIRKAKRAVNSAYAVGLLEKALAKMDDPQASVNQSIERSYTGVFEVKQNGSGYETVGRSVAGIQNGQQIMGVGNGRPARKQNKWLTALVEIAADNVQEWGLDGDAEHSN